ncbi:MAG TPA: glycoside hydrolase family 2 TIM barrel-domain containing protein [Vicinamibacterales bacterium]|jgi:beta-glucuronidase
MRRTVLLACLTFPLLLPASLAGSRADRASSAPRSQAGALPPPAGLIASVETRHTVSLNGSWHFIVDPYEQGYYDYRHQPRKDGYFQKAQPKSKRDLIEYDFDKSDTLVVPGDWNSQKKELFYYEGTIWYERTFSYKKAAGARTFLYVGAANYFSRLYVNGTAVCEHEGGFTSFNCEVTDALKDGDNFVVFSVNNQRRRDAVPTDTTDWWNYGGLTRDVELVEVPAIFLEDFLLQLARGTTDLLSGWVQLNGGSQPVIVRIPELHVEQKVTTDASGRGEIRLQAKGLQPWSPEQPKLYDVELEAGGEVVRDRLGFRTVEVRGRDILVNGKPVFLRGVSVHEEAPLRPGRASSEADATTLLGWVKELNGNFARLAHYPHNRNMARVADRTGVFIWSEIPVYWTIDWENPATLANARRQLAEMIRRDKNRASVVLWSVGNETPVIPPRLTFMRELVRTAHELDPSRPVTAALETHYAEPNVKVIDDPLGKELDVLGCNEYVGWYERTPEDADLITWKTVYDKPLVMSEFGGDARAGLHGGTDERWTEEYQENLYRHQITMLKKIDFLRGTSPWILTDFRSPRRVLPGVQDNYNRKGLISDRGEKKKAFTVLKEFYREK